MRHDAGSRNRHLLSSAILYQAENSSPARDSEASPWPNPAATTTTVHETPSKAISRFDRDVEYLNNAHQITQRVRANTISLPRSAAMDLLPYITYPPLSNEQVIALSDVAGSLRDVVVLALRARVDEHSRETMARAVGPRATEQIVSFFKDEWICDSLY